MAELTECSDVLVSYLPLSHVAAQVLDMIVPLMRGATVYFTPPHAIKVGTQLCTRYDTVYFTYHTETKLAKITKN